MRIAKSSKEQDGYERHRTPWTGARLCFPGPNWHPDHLSVTPKKLRIPEKVSRGIAIFSPKDGPFKCTLTAKRSYRSKDKTIFPKWLPPTISSTARLASVHGRVRSITGLMP